jgi:hypothetical protein
MLPLVAILLLITNYLCCLQWKSIIEHVSDYVAGIVRITCIVIYISCTFLVVFLTIVFKTTCS